MASKVIERQGWWLRAGGRKRPSYFAANGRRLTSASSLKRIKALRIPPAWRDVHISPDPARKIQAWGFDSKGRKQYIYSTEHVQDRDLSKWSRVLRVAEVLPELRSVTNQDLRRRELDSRKVHATVVRLICRAYFRAGSERYAVTNKTFGITTLRKQHVSIVGNSLIFEYRGKRSISHRQIVGDTPLVHIIEELLALPGDRLFQFENGSGAKSVTATSVNRYLHEVLGERYTSKDLRTFGGTVRAATILADIGPAQNPREAKSNVVLACKLVSLDLGNTPAIARKAYIHPAVLEQYQNAGRTMDNIRPSRRRVEAEEPLSYYPEEAALMRFLKRYGK
jgi:DNA topoisomerase-1